MDIRMFKSEGERPPGVDEEDERVYADNQRKNVEKLILLIDKDLILIPEEDQGEYMMNWMSSLITLSINIAINMAPRDKREDSLILYLNEVADRSSRLYRKFEEMEKEDGKV